ncbi:Zn-dependent peptidase ImmA, M78 family [Sulfobacillus thermosulfidooxidans DSM 9293]|uniref:Zn-dependent peptidase ImmA, M78 family n=1 Tax=Sulfobacillus thermosulfidooxidans (strain DSM 9293 / VKM B-1269 / AT-1) TaxID=929705 RepID=A0A1W1W777_SULTA|nr:ImmA/IrrE family metallo-endopeptidase [Sulfobacillus thermosulfidooxidans]SMC01979.1 Zn-dependent peptidase ImmA, M78 family [Sulfobacillus thermosulfidooxidans DSM 9293]
MTVVEAKDLATKTWLAFCDGGTTQELWDEGIRASFDWSQLVTADDAAVVYGSVLLWLRTTPKDEKNRSNVKALLEKIAPDFFETARWLMADLISDLPSITYDDDQWKKVLLSDSNPDITLAVILKDRSAYERSLFHTGVLHHFDHGSKEDRQTIAALIAKCCRSNDPVVSGWAREVMTYPGLFEAVVREDSRIVYRLPPGIQRFVRRQMARKLTDVAVLAARGTPQIDLDISKMVLMREPSPDSLNLWSDPLMKFNALDDDRLRPSEEAPVDVWLLAQRLGVPVYRYDSEVEVGDWWGMIFWDSLYLCPAVVLRPQLEARERFTLAHELGHLWLGRLLPWGTAENEWDMFGQSDEREVNRFASRLLVPIRVVQRQKDWSWSDVEQLADRYKVSRQAAAIAVIEAVQRYALINVKNGFIHWVWTGSQFPRLHVGRESPVPDAIVSCNGYVSARSIVDSREDPGDLVIRVERFDYSAVYSLYWLAII